MSMYERDRQGAILIEQFQRTLASIVPEEPGSISSERGRLFGRLSPYLTEYPFMATDAALVTRLRDTLRTPPRVPGVIQLHGSDAVDAWMRREQDRLIREELGVERAIREYEIVHPGTGDELRARAQTSPTLRKWLLIPREEIPTITLGSDELERLKRLLRKDVEIALRHFVERNRRNRYNPDENDLQ